MLSKVGSYQFLAEPFHCDFSNRLFMGHLGNHLLNAADFHANDRRFGMHYLNSIKKTWVISRLAIEMDEMPLSYARFTVETWIENAMRFFTARNFQVTDVDTGKIYGYGRSIWAMIDTETRQPTNILEIHDGLLSTFVEKDKPCPIDNVSRVKMTEKGEFVRAIQTNYSDVDMNEHINSIKYIEHVLDLWNLDWYTKHPIHRFEIAYVAESHCGDTLLFYSEKVDEFTFCVRIMKKETPNADEVEVCRSQVTFKH